MAYRDEDRGFPLARVLPSSHPKSSYSIRYLRVGLEPDRGAPNLEKWNVLMGIQKHKGTIAAKGIKPSQETYDTSIQSQDILDQSMAGSRTYRGAMG